MIPNINQKTKKLRYAPEHVMLATLMPINVEVEKHNNESSANVIRRFTKRVQASSIINRMRRIRYFTRTKSENVKKAGRLKKLEKKAEYERLFKLGKIQDRSSRKR